MKKIKKYILYIIILIIAFIIDAIIIDTINAKVFHKSPIISKHYVLDNYNYVDKGIIFDIYYCQHSSDLVYVSWKFKFNNFECPTTEYSSMINKIDHVFIKTYTIDKIEKIDKNNIYLTITNEDINYKVKTRNFNNLKEKNKYEFLFKIISNNIEEDIDSIFNNTEIISITKTDKDINQFVR